MKDARTVPLRLPRSRKDAVDKIGGDGARRKEPSPETARLFADRKARADFKAFDKLMRRRGGQPPREGDKGTSRARAVKKRS